MMAEEKNLCDNCLYVFGACEGEIEQGEGANVIRCNTYTSDGSDGGPTDSPEGPNVSPNPQNDSEKPPIEPPIVKEIVDHGKCASCDSPLKETKINRRGRGILCTNPRCALYRTRIRQHYIPLPKTKGKGKGKK